MGGISGVATDRFDPDILKVLRLHAPVKSVHRLRLRRQLHLRGHRSLPVEFRCKIKREPKNRSPGGFLSMFCLLVEAVRLLGAPVIFQFFCLGIPLTAVVFMRLINYMLRIPWETRGDIFN